MKKRDLILVAVAVITALSLAWGILQGRTAPTVSWGLHFASPGATPQGPETAAALEQVSGAYLGNTEEKVLYLTFDAGYENGCTEKILDVLEQHRVKAAFFLVGHYMEQNPELVKRMASQGHTVGNHTLHHKDMQKLSGDAFSQEITGLEAVYRNITGQELPKFYRPPQGNYTRQNLEQAQKLGYKTVFWSLAYADWDNKNQPDPQKAMDKLLSRTHNGAVVLLHSTSQTNAEILDELLTAWESQGYRFGTLEELFS